MVGLVASKIDNAINPRKTYQRGSGLGLPTQDIRVYIPTRLHQGFYIFLIRYTPRKHNLCNSTENLAMTCVCVNHTKRGSYSSNAN